MNITDFNGKVLYVFLWTIFLYASLIGIPCRIKRLPSYTEYTEFATNRVE